MQMGVAPSRLYYANGSRGTQAGLALGAKLWRAPWVVQGIAVSGGEPEKIHRAVRIAGEAARLIGIDVTVAAGRACQRQQLHWPGLRRVD